MVVTEALARGMPVVATAVGGVPEALGHGADGAGRACSCRPATRRRSPPRCARWLDRRRPARRGCAAPPASGARRSTGWSATTAAARRRPAGGRRDERRATARVSSELAGAARAGRRRGPRARPGRSRSRRTCPATAGLVIHDLGCGTGSMGRWLAPRLPGPQHWVLHDRDADLLELAAAAPARPPPTASAVTVETRQSDITRLSPDDLAGAAPGHRLGAAGHADRRRAGRGWSPPAPAPACPVLLTLSVVGRVELTPADPLDARVGRGVQRPPAPRDGRGRLLGPDAVAAAVEAFGRRGARRRSSGPARGGSAPARPTWPPSGSPAGWAPRASSSPSWPPRPAPTPTDAAPRPPPAGSPSPSTTPTCWCCPHDAGRR